MNYNEFKIAMTAQVANLVGEEVNVTLRQVYKNNGVLMEGLAILDKTTNISPTIYMEPLYEKHQQGVSMERLAELLLQEYERSKPKGMVNLEYFMNFQMVRKRICYKLINYQKNKTFLSEVPHVRYLDLAMVFYCYLDESYGSGATMLVRNSEMKRWATNVSELEQLARVNTPEHLPVLFTSMHQVVREIFEEEQEDLLLLDENLTEAVPMYILTNQTKCNGAAVICYPEVLETIKEIVGGAFYVLPSSIHEVIITPLSGQYSLEELEEMVTDINRNEVEEQEVLSNRVYVYDTEKKALTLQIYGH